MPSRRLFPICTARSPQRGPMVSPSSGVIPINVSTLFPSRIAAVQYGHMTQSVCEYSFRENNLKESTFGVGAGKYYSVISERKSPRACTTIPIVSFALFMYGPKWRRSPVRKCVALHRCAEANTGRSFSGSNRVHRSPATSGTRRTVPRISDNRPRADGCFLSRFSRASARQYALVTTSQFPAAANSMTREAFPSGL